MLSAYSLARLKPTHLNPHTHTNYANYVDGVRVKHLTALVLNICITHTHTHTHSSENVFSDHASWASIVMAFGHRPR